MASFTIIKPQISQNFIFIMAADLLLLASLHDIKASVWRINTVNMKSHINFPVAAIVLIQPKSSVSYAGFDTDSG